MAEVNSLVVGYYGGDYVLRIPCDGGGYLATNESVPVPFAQGGSTFYAPIGGRGPNQLAPHSYDGAHVIPVAGDGPTAGSLFVLLERVEGDPDLIAAYDMQTGVFQRSAATPTAGESANFLIDPQGAIFCWNQDQIWKWPADGSAPSVFVQDIVPPPFEGGYYIGGQTLRWSPEGDLCLFNPSPNGPVIVRYDQAGNFQGSVVSKQQALDSSPYQKEEPNFYLPDYEDFAFGPDGHVYALDYTWNRVVRFNGSTGDYMDVFLDDVDAFVGWGALGLQFSPDGQFLYVATVNDYPRQGIWDLLGAMQVFPAKGGPFVSFIYQGEQFGGAMTFITQEFQFRPPVSTIRPPAPPPPPPWQTDFLIRALATSHRPGRRPMRRSSQARSEMKKNALEFWYGLDEDAKQAVTAVGILRLGRIFQDQEIVAGIREVFERKFNTIQLKRLKSLLDTSHLEEAKD